MRLLGDEDIYFIEDEDATVFVAEVPFLKHVQILAPPGGLAEMEPDAILELLRASSRVGKKYEDAGWKVGY